MKIGLLSTIILTGDGDYTLRTITQEDARAVIAGKELDSAIGHASTAEVLADELGVPVAVNRQEFAQQAGQTAIVIKVAGRGLPPDTTADQIRDRGYTLRLLTRTA